MQIFDGRNNALSRLWCGPHDPVRAFAQPLGQVNIPHAGDLPNLVQAMADHGYRAALIAKPCNENWLTFLARHLGNP